MQLKLYKNQFGCTEMCLCANCENIGDETDKFCTDHKDDIL